MYPLTKSNIVTKTACTTGTVTYEFT